MKPDVNDYRFAYLTLTLLPHYLVKCRSRILAVYNSEYILDSACISSEYYCVTTKSLQICCHPVDYIVRSVLCERVYRNKSQNVDELKQRINSEWAALSHAVIERAVGEWRQRLRACVRAAGGHF